MIATRAAFILLSALLLLMTASSARALDVVLTTPDGDAVPGRPTRLHVAAIDDDGQPVRDLSVLAERGTVQPDAEPDLPPGVTGWLWTPGGPGDTRIEVAAGGASKAFQLPVRPLPDLDLGVPGRLESPAGAPVLLRLTDPGRPGPDDLVISTSEPSDVDVRETGDALELRLRPEGQGARVLLVTLSDRRRPTRPQLVRVRIVDRPTLAFDVEPGARLTVRIGSRSYGPFEADPEGRVRASVEQRPGERSAEIVVTDDLGNTLITPYVLSAIAAPPMVVATLGDPLPGGRPPDVIVHATTVDGRAWTGRAPECRVPGGAEPLPALRLVPGVWRVAGVGPARLTSDSLRLSCTLRDSRIDMRRRAPPGIPVALDLRVGPDPISLDFPVAEVTAHLVDAAGERISADAVQVSAERGAVRLEAPSGGSRRGEYRAGSQALVEGSDRVVATWSRPLGEGRAAGVQVGHGVVPVVGLLRVQGRAVDARGRPLPGAPVVLRAGASEWSGVADDRGWATAELPIPEGLLPMVVEARSGPWVARRLAPRSSPARGPGPGRPDLVDTVQITLTTGRAASIEIRTDDPVLYLRPGASMPVRIQVLDRGGQPIPNEVPALTVDHGRVGVPRPHPDGGFEAVYTPPPDASPRDVTLTARAGSGTATGAARLRLAAPPLRTAAGLGLGVISNLRRLTSPYLMLHVERRTFVDAVTFRGGVAVYGGAATVESDVATQRSRITLFPIQASALYRPQMGRWQLWGGATLQLVPYFTTRVQDEARLPALQGVLPPGVGLVLGVGRRIRGGEVMIELQPVFQFGAPSSGFTGQLGGLSSYLGYRAVFD